ncbi:MAG: hypothetical protein Q9178_001558 [Gyalolechia marmorata]
MAASARAVCKNTECKNQKIKIGKNELRYGVWVEFGEHQSWAWRHWGCVTPMQLAGLQDKLEGDVDMLDGYEDLPDDCQEKVKRAIENGHVDDDDWKGDIEQNRPGMRGFRSPAAKKKKKAEEQELSEAQEGNGSPPKASPKKRGRPKKDVSKDEDNEEPAQKKTKVTVKRGKKIKGEGEDDDMAEDEENDDASKPKAKRGKQTKGKDVESEVAAKPKAKASAKKTKALKEEEEPVTDERDVAATVPTKPKAAIKKGKKAKKDEDTENPDAEAQPVNAGTRSRKAKVEDAKEDLSANEHEEAAVKSTKKPRATKNAANTKKPIAKKAQKDVGGAVNAEGLEEEAPKARRSRKKADK